MVLTIGTKEKSVQPWNLEMNVILYKYSLDSTVA